MNLYLITWLLTAVLASKKEEESSSDSPKKTSTLSASSSSSSSSLASSSSSSSSSTPSHLAYEDLDPNFLRLPLYESDYAYGVKLTAPDGSDTYVHLDIIQPDIWLINAEKILSCDTLADHVNDSDSSYVTVSSHVYAANGCYLDGAITPKTTITTTQNNQKETSTENFVIQTDDSDVSLAAYPQAAYNKGAYVLSNLSVVSTNNSRIHLNDFEYFLADAAFLFSGGIGLASSVDGRGFLNTMKSSGAILADSYSVYLGATNSNETAGELMLGAVDQGYYTGDLYQFPLLPYEGTDMEVKLPTLLLNDIRLNNKETDKSISLLNNQAFPVLLDSRLSFNSLPLETIINLALQLNAFYNAELGSWIVKCSDVEDSKAEIQFKFGNQTIIAPATSFIEDAVDVQLNFSTGGRACALNVSPSTYLGFNCLGLPFLKHVYWAMDNEGGNIAIANINTKLDIPAEDFDFTSSAKLYSTASAQTQGGQNKTAAYITSGLIPFATKGSVPSTTLTFYPGNTTVSDTLLSNYPWATVVSGEVFITGQRPKASSTTSTSAAKSTTASGYGSQLFIHKRLDGQSKVVYSTLFFAFLLGLLLA